MILFIWSPSTFSHFANDRIHKNTILLIKHIIDKEKIETTQFYHHPGFPSAILTLYQNYLLLYLKQLYGKGRQIKLHLIKGRVFNLIETFGKKLCFHFSAARRVSTRSRLCRRVTTWKDLKIRSFNIASNTPQSCTRFRRN